MSRRCYLCGYGGKRRSFIGYGDHHICDPCWDSCEGDVKGALMAKKKKADAKGRAWPEIQPCKWCGGDDFENDFARRAHQGKCPKNPKNKEGAAPSKKKAGKAKKKRSPQQVGRGSKQKGSKYENSIRKILSVWYGEDPKLPAKESAFQRSPGSGGTSPVNWPLDIHVPNDFPWAVECKNREGAKGMENMERFLKDGYPVVDWFRTAEEEILEHGCEMRAVLLVFTRNTFPNYVAFRRPAMTKGMFMTYAFPHVTLCGQPFGELVICKLEDLLALGDKDYWNTVYNTCDANSFMPRRWDG